MILSLIEDTRQKPGKHTIKNAYWYIMGITEIGRASCRERV